MVHLKSIQKISKLFQPMTAVSKNQSLESSESLSKSQRLLIDLGIIKPVGHGYFNFLPLGMRVLEKLKAIVNEEMVKIDAQKVTLPALTSSKLWKKSGRLDDELSSELFKVRDRQEDTYILSPTHEEAITDLLASCSQISYKQFPLKLYQITSKFRDEMKPRFGLIRSREFLMKDLYSFDVDLNAAKQSYNEIGSSYDAIFQRIGVPYVKVHGSSGNMGNSFSHEYHFIAPIGEDKLISCKNCGYKANIQLHSENKCFKCGNANDLNSILGLEVGHTFFLGDKYSRPLNAFYRSKSDKLEPLQMGSYGLGLSRILASAVEVLSTEHEIRWPEAIAPFTLAVIPPKEGSKEEKNMGMVLDDVLNAINKIPSITNDIILDDRKHLTVGRRLLDCKRVGYPYVLLIGSKILENPPLYELINVNKNCTEYLSADAVVNFFKSRNLEFEPLRAVN